MSKGERRTRSSSFGTSAKDSSLSVEQLQLKNLQDSNGGEVLDRNNGGGTANSTRSKEDDDQYSAENIQKFNDSKKEQIVVEVDPFAEYEEVSPPPSYDQAMLEKQRKANNLMGSEVPKGLNVKPDVKIVAPSAAILANIEKAQQGIGEQQAQLDEKFVANIKSSGPKKHQQQIADALKDQSNVQAILQLTNLQQSLATNQIMLVFQQQNERLQEQVNPKSPHYVQYNSKEQNLIAQIQQQADVLYNNGRLLDHNITITTNQKRAAKLVDSKLLDTKFSGLSDKLRLRDKGLQLNEVNPHYSYEDLQVILKQFKDANKEMDALIKMPDLAKRSSILSTLYDCTTTLAKKAAFLVPQTATAAFSVAEYAIMTVVVDSVKQGWTAAQNAGQGVLDRRDAYIDIKLLERNNTISQSINKNRDKARELMEDFKTKADSIINALPDNDNNKMIKNTYNSLIKSGMKNSKDALLVLSLFENNKINFKDLPKVQPLINLEKQFEQLNKKLENVEKQPLTRLATAILGVPAAVIWGGIVGAAVTVATGAANMTVNAPDGIKKNYQGHAKNKIISDDKKHSVIEDKPWNRSASEIYAVDKNARKKAHTTEAEVAVARATLSNEIKNQPTRSSQFEIQKNDAIEKNEGIEVNLQDGKVNLQQHIAITEAAIKVREEALQKYIDGPAGLIKSATPESYIKNRVLTQNKELLDNVIELTKLQQQNAVSNIMLAFLNHAESVNKQVYKIGPQEQKINDEIQDLAQQLAEKTFLLNEKIKSEINSKRADRLEKNDLVKQLNQASVNLNSSTETLGAVTDGNYNLKDLERIRAVFKKANKDMDGLLKMPDVSKRCGLLASLYDGATTLAKSSAFLIPKTVAAAVSIVQYVVMTVVVDTISQGWGAAQRVTSGVSDAISNSINNKLATRLEAIKFTYESIKQQREGHKKIILEYTDEVIKEVQSNSTSQENFTKRYNDLKKQGNVSEIYKFFKEKTKGHTFPKYVEESVVEFTNLSTQLSALKNQFEKMEILSPVIKFAIPWVAIPVGGILGAVGGAARTVVAGVKNATFQANQGEQLGDKWRQLIMNEHGNKKPWARSAGEVHNDGKEARDKAHAGKKKMSLAAQELARQAKSQKNLGSSVPGHS